MSSGQTTTPVAASNDESAPTASGAALVPTAVAAVAAGGAVAQAKAAQGAEASGQATDSPQDAEGGSRASVSAASAAALVAGAGATAQAKGGQKSAGADSPTSNPAEAGGVSESATNRGSEATATSVDPTLAQEDDKQTRAEKQQEMQDKLKAKGAKSLNEGERHKAGSATPPAQEAGAATQMAASAEPPIPNAEQQLRDIGMQRQEVKGDGDCYYTSIGRQVYPQLTDQEGAKVVRSELHSYYQKQLKDNPNLSDTSTLPGTELSRGVVQKMVDSGAVLRSASERESGSGYSEWLEKPDVKSLGANPHWGGNDHHGAIAKIYQRPVVEITGEASGSRETSAPTIVEPRSGGEGFSQVFGEGYQSNVSRIQGMRQTQDRSAAPIMLSLQRTGAGNHYENLEAQQPSSTGSS